ncbi:MAG: cell division protein FtsZ [Candidatus Bipolaricaulota bacterium]
MAPESDESGQRGESGARASWRAIRNAIDDQVLRACLPLDPAALRVDGRTVFIDVDSEFKREYCRRKQDKVAAAVERVLGPRDVTFDLPLVAGVSLDAPAPPGRGSARIAVLGIGAGGVNAVVRMRAERLSGVRLVAVDTDRQVLQAAAMPESLQLGLDVTGGRGTGGQVDKGRRAAAESRWEVGKLVEGADLVFLTAGLGGGTGTGAAPGVAAMARESGALTIGVVTRPFAFEGATRRQNAERGIEELRAAADVLIVVSNDRLLETSARGMPMAKAFDLADGILHQGVRGISDLITVRGLINLDFADVRSLLERAGEAMMGMGRADGPGRALAAAKAASTNPLLEGDSIRGARKLIMNVTGGGDLTLGEVMLAADHVRRAAATECDLIFGAVIRPEVADGLQITVIAAGFRGEEALEREEHRAARRERVPRNTNLDVPTFLRRERGTGEEER